MSGARFLSTPSLDILFHCTRDLARVLGPLRHSCGNAFSSSAVCGRSTVNLIWYGRIFSVVRSPLARCILLHLKRVCGGIFLFLADAIQHWLVYWHRDFCCLEHLRLPVYVGYVASASIRVRFPDLVLALCPLIRWVALESYMQDIPMRVLVIFRVLLWSLSGRNVSLADPASHKFLYCFPAGRTFVGLTLRHLNLGKLSLVRPVRALSRLAA